MATATEARPGLGALSDHLADQAARLRPSVVSIHTGPRGAPAQRSGAGVIWQPDGLIVTNAHVIHEPRARVLLDDGRDFEATLVAHDPALDLAALRVPATGLPAARVGDSNTLRVGQLVFAMGHPLGQAHAVAWGIVSAPVGTSAGPAGAQGRPSSTIQADLRLYPGNSGGPLADARGHVVGINHMVSPPRMAFAIASATVLGFLARVLGPRLGVRVRTVGLPPPLVQRLNLPRDRAVMVVEVAGGEAGARAGLLPGDVLLAANDRWLDGAEALAAALARPEANGSAVQTPLLSLELRVLRGGTVRVVPVELRSAA